MASNLHVCMLEHSRKSTIIYTVGAALSESSCVNVCLVAMDGRAAMHRISPFFDPQCDSLDMDKTCRVCVYLCVCVMCVCVLCVRAPARTCMCAFVCGCLLTRSFK